MTNDAVLAKLAELAGVDRESAAEIEEQWTLTLAALRAGADDSTPILGGDLEIMKRQLDLELDDRLAPHRGVSP